MSQNLIHLVTAVKYRRRVPPDVAVFVELEAFKVMQYIGIQPIAIGFDENHIHVLFDLPRTRTLEEIARRFKAITSKRVRAKFPHLAETIKHNAFWQKRFLYKSLGGMTKDNTLRYIERQQAFTAKD